MIVKTMLHKISYLQRRNGELFPMVYFYPFTIGELRYEKARISISLLIKFISCKIRETDYLLINTLGPKSMIIGMEHREANNEDFIKLPTRCNACNKQLRLYNLSAFASLKCLNPQCPSRIIKDLYTFLKVYHVKGYGEASLRYFMCLYKDVTIVIRRIGWNWLKQLVLENNVETLINALGFFRYGKLLDEAQNKSNLFIGIKLDYPVSEFKDPIIEYLEANKVNSMVDTILKMIRE